MSYGLAQGDGDIGLAAAEAAAGGFPTVLSTGIMNPIAGDNDGFYPDPFASIFVDPSTEGDFGAQETLARLYDAEFQDYLQRFFPVEQRLMFDMQEGFAEQQQAEINRAQRTAARTFANIRGQEQRRRAGFGMNVDGATNAALDRAETGAIVAARNFARMRAEERRLQILSGGLGSIAQQRTSTTV